MLAILKTIRYNTHCNRCSGAGICSAEKSYRLPRLGVKLSIPYGVGRSAKADTYPISVTANLLAPTNPFQRNLLLRFILWKMPTAYDTIYTRNGLFCCRLERLNNLTNQRLGHFLYQWAQAPGLNQFVLVGGHRYKIKE